MAHRLPVIAGYADGSADDLVLDGQTGYRLLSTSASVLGELIDRVLSSPDTSEELGYAGERLVRNSLSFKAFTGRVVETLAAQSKRVGAEA
jgi:glycosyltransferase involved in cell wall biosynthesis